MDIVSTSGVDDIFHSFVKCYIGFKIVQTFPEKNRDFEPWSYMTGFKKNAMLVIIVNNILCWLHLGCYAYINPVTTGKIRRYVDRPSKIVWRFRIHNIPGAREPKLFSCFEDSVFYISEKRFCYKTKLKIIRQDFKFSYKLIKFSNKIQSLSTHIDPIQESIPGERFRTFLKLC